MELLTAKIDHAQKIDEARRKLDDRARIIADQTGSTPLNFDDFIKQHRSFWQGPTGSILGGLGLGAGLGGIAGFMLAGGALAGAMFFAPLAIGAAGGMALGLMRGFLNETDEVRDYDKYLTRFAMEAQVKGKARGYNGGLSVNVPSLPGRNQERGAAPNLPG